MESWMTKHLFCFSLKMFSFIFYSGMDDRRSSHYIWESILQIYIFDEKDVNVDYSCSIGGYENRTILSLAPDKFEC
jgi:hypothetical protein